ncbi:hypothetical protein [Herbaspirillum sp. ST 5-3]|uniref:hypothetical protein n=1 Tax=Oxalobacteraceae TaxID=75682 RepID=UPI0010A48C4F|nr:hypothetical protein [Herbaspirillum sp. ST 5-3]
MGLDATVYCDCFELGRLKSAPKPEWSVFVAEDGSRCSSAGDINLLVDFDKWNIEACEHLDGVLLSLRLGNISLVSALSAQVKKTWADFPILLNRVLYSGSHTGDYIETNLVLGLQAEVARLAHVHAECAEDEEAIRLFHAELEELVSCALRVHKPIAF